MLTNAFLALLLRCHVSYRFISFSSISMRCLVMSANFIFSFANYSMNERGNDFSEAKRPTSFQIPDNLYIRNARIYM